LVLFNRRIDGCYYVEFQLFKLIIHRFLTENKQVANRLLTDFLKNHARKFV